MRVGLIDVDAESRGKVTFPNLSLMKISAWHKLQGDSVEWYRPLESGHMDRVYMSKVFGDEYTEDYQWAVDADEVIRGGSGYAISIKDGREVHDKDKDFDLPYEVEHITPDYALYGITDTAYGFLTRGCPKGCEFCHVASMQGRRTRTVARLNEFWSGQKYIELLDANLTASRDWKMHMEDLIASEAAVSFNQGLDIGLINEDKIADLNRLKWKRIHFAWDKPEEPYAERFEMLAKNLDRANRTRVSVYVLTNAGSTHEQDLQRIMTVRALGLQPYVMIYRKHTAPKETRKLQRWVNNPMLFWSNETFSEYLGGLNHAKLP